MTVWLARIRKPVVFTVLPMIFMIGMTGWAMHSNLQTFFNAGNWLLFGIGTAVAALEIWMVLEGIGVLAKLCCKEK
jgi:carbon starvation protein